MGDDRTMPSIDVRRSLDGKGFGGYSPDGSHRYWFHLDLRGRTPEHRVHENGIPLIDSRTFVWIGLNPSTGDDDGNRRATLDRVEKTARAEGASRQLGLNLYSYRATSPAGLKAYLRATRGSRAEDALNDHIINQALFSHYPVLTCWGASGSLNGRGNEVLSRLPFTARLGTTKDGQPWHPLQRSGQSRFELHGYPPEQRTKPIDLHHTVRTDTGQTITEAANEPKTSEPSQTHRRELAQRVRERWRNVDKKELALLAVGAALAVIEARQKDKGHRRKR